MNLAKIRIFGLKIANFEYFFTAVLPKNIFWAGAAKTKMADHGYCFEWFELTDGHCGRMKHELSGARLIFLLTPPPQIWPHHIHVHILIYLSLSTIYAGLNKWQDSI